MGNFFESILDLFYPRFCYSCQERVKEIGPVYLCNRCLSRVALINAPVCSICGRPGFEKICPYCFEEKPLFKMARAAGPYEGILKEGIHRLKYNGHTFLIPTLGRFLLEAFEKENEWQGRIDLILPVPMERTRERQRGFNQSVLLARYLAGHLSLPYNRRVLLKLKKTIPQVNLSKEKRLFNLSNAFFLNPRRAVLDKRLLLIDDVYTTGSTVIECTRILLRAGAKEVNILTLARGL